MATRRQRRKAKKERARHRREPGEWPASMRASPVVLYARPAAGVERLTYTRRQAAEALGVSLSTIDRRIVPVLDTFFNEWGMRLIPADELKRYIAENVRPALAKQKPGRRPGRRPTVPPDVVARIRAEHADGSSLGQIARRLNEDGIATAQGGRKWWPSTVREVLSRTFRDGR
jgi:Recombinase